MVFVQLENGITRYYITVQSVVMTQKISSAYVFKFELSFLPSQWPTQ